MAVVANMDSIRQPQQQQQQNDKGNDIINNTNDNVDAISATQQQLQVEEGTQRDDDNYIRLQLRRFILIVEYDGTRYSGFQRQTSPSSSIASMASDYRKSNNNSNNKKRKHIDSNDTATPMTMTKRALQRICPVTIQECLEDSILDYCNNQLLVPSRGGCGSGGKNKKKRREKKKEKRQQQQKQEQQQDEEDEHANEEERQSKQEEHPKMTRSDMEFKFSSRTDAGVHARGQVVAVNLPTVTLFQEPQSGKTSLLRKPSIMQSIQKSINSRLPKDISISYVSLCTDPNFNPRYGVQRKQYSYTIKYLRRQSNHQLDNTISSPNGKNNDIVSGPQLIRSALPTNSNQSTTWICPWMIDDSQFDTYCDWLSGRHDYTVFCHKSVRRKQQQQRGQEQGQNQQRETIRTEVMDHDDADKDSNVLTITKFTCERDDTSHVLQQQNRQQHVKSITIQYEDQATLEDDNHNDGGRSKSSDEPVVEVVTATFRIEAKGFRRSMIRNLIGFIVDLGRGEIPCPFTTTIDNDDDIKSANSSPSLSLRDRIWTGSEDIAKLVNQAPACGLCLEYVQY